MTEIKELIFEVIDDINGQLPSGNQLEKSPDTIIIGDGSALDSLGVVNFLVSLEEKVAAATGQSLALLRDDLLGEQNDVLRTVANIDRYIANHL